MSGSVSRLVKKSMGYEEVCNDTNVSCVEGYFNQKKNQRQNKKLGTHMSGVNKI